jgi:hypothetical protein
MLRRLELKTQRSKNLEGEGERAARPRLDNDGPITEAQPPHCLLLHEPNLSPEVWSTAVMSLILFVADSRGGGAGENSD